MLLFDALSLYGLIYLGGVLLLFIFIRVFLQLTLLQNLFYCTYLSLGAILGARLFYIVFYSRGYFQDHPGDIFKLYLGGMSFHGAVLGLLTAVALCGRPYRLQLLDLCALTALICLPVGRICNFLNGELYGRLSTFDFGVVFAAAGPQLRYPSQLFEAAAEGPVCALLLWLCRRHGLLKNPGDLAFGFSLFYALLRFVVEFTREPDAQLGLLALNLSLGQWLCLLQALLTLLCRYCCRVYAPAPDSRRSSKIRSSIRAKSSGR